MLKETHLTNLPLTFCIVALTRLLGKIFLKSTKIYDKHLDILAYVLL